MPWLQKRVFENGFIRNAFIKLFEVMVKITSVFFIFLIDSEILKSYPIFVYAGSLSVWQNFEETLKIFKLIEDRIPSATLTLGYLAIHI